MSKCEGVADPPHAPGNGRAWLRSLAIPASSVLVLLVATVTVLGRVSSAEHGRPAIVDPVATGSVYSCLSLGEPSPEERAACQRTAEDQSRRLPLTDQQRSAGFSAQTRVNAAATQARFNRCRSATSTASESACLASSHSRPVAEDVTAVAQALTAGGYLPEVVRLARPDDPAPVGSLLYAVRTDGLCVVHFYGPHGGGGFIGGTYPDGRCLKA